MKNDYSYAREKLSNAIEILAIAPGDVRSRLHRAFLEFHTLQVDNFPTEMQKDWLWINKQLTKYGHVENHKGEVWIGSVKNTMSKIKNGCCPYLYPIYIY